MRNLLFLFVIFTITFSGCARSAQQYVAQAKSKYDAQDFKGAIFDYSKAIAKDPGLPEAYYSRGIAKRTFRKNCVGIYFTPKSNTVQPKNQSSTSSVEKLFPFCMGEIDDYTRAIGLNPAYADAYFSRGLAEIDFGLLDSACIDLKKAGSLGNEEAQDLILLNCR
ncbi:MAG: tetratricopeptide repeat protein [Bacteroidetes bacterium]|nr:tetratricopeptide repeat protein [Bacteroidota bacterium]